MIEGNERVVRPRLADAKFFFDQDRKKTLDSRVAGAGQGGLSRQARHAGRARRARARDRARDRRSSSAATRWPRQADRAALLAKADLLTDMVGEFPELQGIMGGYYARHDGEGDEVAVAIEDHYKPRFAGDALPRNAAGVVVALADKLETLVGLFGIGQLPTGDKDPFALRRHALGVIRMLIERDAAARRCDALVGAAPSRPSPPGTSPSAARRARRLHLRAPGRLPARAGLQRAGGRCGAGAAAAAPGPRCRSGWPRCAPSPRCPRRRRWPRRTSASATS